MPTETPLDRFKAVLGGAARAVAHEPEIELAFTAQTANAWGAACRKGDGELVALLDEGIAGADLAGVWARWLGALAYPL